jgi:hypothetical protein
MCRLIQELNKCLAYDENEARKEIERHSSETIKWRSNRKLCPSMTDSPTTNYYKPILDESLANFDKNEPQKQWRGRYHLIYPYLC